jgi:alpha-glucan,water dikinase
MMHLFFGELFVFFPSPMRWQDERWGGNAGLCSWQVISPVDVRGFVEVVEELEHVQDKVYERPTILVSGRVKGEEEIPDGAIAVLTPDMPDVLSHVSVRARNSKVRRLEPI